MINLFNMYLYIKVFYKLIFFEFIYLSYGIEIRNELFQAYTNQWLQRHQNWIHIDKHKVDLLKESCKGIIFPTCIGNSSIDGFPCSNILCYENATSSNSKQYLPTPSDTIDYMPPLSTIDSRLNISSDVDYLCYPPSKDISVDTNTYNMASGIYPYNITNTNIRLIVSGRILGYNDTSLFPIARTSIEAWQVDPMKLQSSRNLSSLRLSSCFNKFSTENDGSYTFETIIPFSYGPPRHISFAISAEGFKPLLTNAYFDLDIRLLELTTTEFYDISIIKTNPINNDPRVMHLNWITDHIINATDQESIGHFEANFNIVLSTSTEISEFNIPSTSFDLSGYWYESQTGGKVLVETFGNLFYASEYPHRRTFGTISGYIFRDTIYDVRFDNLIPQVVINDASWDIFQRQHTSNEVIGIIQQSSDNPNYLISPLITTISWSNNIFWSKLLDFTSTGYRFLKVIFHKYNNDEIIEFNEIIFYEGILSNIRKPGLNMIMNSPRNPSPQIVTCSSFLNQAYHCFKAFDGNTSSSWKSKQINDKSVLLSDEYILFDFGYNNYVSPTSMQIICSGIGLPLSFSLQGSRDNIDYFNIYKNDYLVTTQFSNTFYFLFETMIGRPLYHTCGSCDTYPMFSCSFQSYDPSCISKYCNNEGLCDNLPSCSLGEYFDSASFTCKLCRSGSFGIELGLVSIDCSGLCDFDYYCLEGSTSPTQFQCPNDPSLYCPVGSSLPIPIPSGYYKIQELPGIEFCPKGYYCNEGIKFPCPRGSFGNTSGLSTPDCSASCISGEYCYEASITPILCPKGSYCPNGVDILPCPSGRYGNLMGLSTSNCSGLCLRGYYCSEGSTNSRSSVCPAGRYGSVKGLSSSLCEGPCSEGYYCPPKSTNSSMVACGENARYCPQGSAFPLEVSFGYYSIGGLNTTRSGQKICEKGYYCNHAVKIACEAGTYGDSEGLFTDDCSGLCKSGYYCPSASISATEIPCPAGRYGSSFGLTNSSCTALCPLGYFCPEGSASPIACQNGSYGAELGLSSSFCSGKCKPGYFCQEASISAIQFECGNSSVYCPQGSIKPITIPQGFYGDGDLLRTFSTISICPIVYYCFNGIKFICPSGTFGNSLGLFNHSCSGICNAGTFCPEGSQFPIPCPGGTFGRTNGLSTSSCSGKCQAGFYCPLKSTSSKQFSCNEVARFSAEYISIIFQTLPYSEYFINNPVEFGIPYAKINSFLKTILTTNITSDDVHNGFINSYFYNYMFDSTNYSDYFDIEFGANNSDTKVLLKYINSVYCPTGSEYPILLREGYYLVQNIPNLCPIGYYCTRGDKFICPAGFYGNKLGLSTSTCSGLCPRGFYCFEGATNPTATPCLEGYHGAIEGLSTPTCSGPCMFPLDCPQGSIYDNKFRVTQQY